MKLFTIIKSIEGKIKEYEVYTATYIKYIKETQEKKVYYQYLLIEGENNIKIFDEKENLLKYLTYDINIFETELPF